MGYLHWPPRWWRFTSLSPAPPVDEEKERERRDYLAGFFSVPAGAPDREPTEEEMIEAEASFEEWWANRNRLCERCGRRNFAGQPLHAMNNRQDVCIDCFCFLTGIDERDPIEDPTARSEDPRYVSRHRRSRKDDLALAREPDLPDAGYERPLLAPLPPGTPRWVRFLHWLGVEMTGQR